jgi:hypothetical protein
MRLRLMDDEYQATPFFGWLACAICLFVPLLLLGGCGDKLPLGTGSAPVTAPAASSGAVALSDRVIIKGGQALVIANAAYQTIGTAAAIGIEKGVITGPLKVEVKAASARVSSALDKGNRALQSGDKAASAVEALDGLDKLCDLTPVLATACKVLR